MTDHGLLQALQQDAAAHPTGEFDQMSVAAIECRAAVIAAGLTENSPAATEAFLASPPGQKGGPGRVAELRALFDNVRDWQFSRLDDCLAELARRQAAAEVAKQEATAGLYFGPWRGF